MDGQDQSGIFAAAIRWLVNLATGDLALVIATVAIAVVGLMMLDGRVDWRRGARVILGCFLIFGAGSISSAFMASGRDAAPQQAARISQPVVETKSPNDDPWAASYLKPEAQQPVQKP